MAIAQDGHVGLRVREALQREPLLDKVEDKRLDVRLLQQCRSNAWLPILCQPQVNCLRAARPNRRPHDSKINRREAECFRAWPAKAQRAAPPLCNRTCTRSLGVCTTGERDIIVRVRVPLDSPTPTSCPPKPSSDVSPRAVDEPDSSKQPQRDELAPSLHEPPPTAGADATSRNGEPVSATARKRCPSTK